MKHAAFEQARTNRQRDPAQGTGAWAVLIVLHKFGLEEGLTKDQIADRAGQHKLCNVPLLEAKEGNTWFSAWSAHTKLVERGLLASVRGVGRKEYWFLTVPGKAKASGWLKI